MSGGASAGAGPGAQAGQDREPDAREGRRPRISTIGRVLVALLVPLPWVYGAVHAPARAAYVAVIALLFVIAGVRRLRADAGVRSAGAPAVLLLAAFAWAALALVPLPAGVLAGVAPASHRIAVASFAEAGLRAPAWHPIAVAPRDAAEGLATAAAHVMVFLLAARTLGGRRGARLLAGVLAASGAAMGLLAIAQEALDAKRIFFFALAREQFYGTFVNGNHAATFLAMCTVAALGLLLREREPGKKLTWGLCGVISAVAAMYSLSRGGIVALLAALVVFLAGAIALQAAARKQSADEIGRFFRRNMVPLMLVGLAAFYLSWLGPRKIGRELSTLAALDLPRDYRTQVWSDSLGAVGDWPLTGAGGGTFRHVFPQYRSFPADVTTEMAESDWVQLLVENGAIGFLLLGGALALVMGRFGAAFVKDPLRFSGAHLGVGVALFVVVAHGMVDFPARIPALGAIAAACAGVLVGAVRRADEEEKGRRGGARLVLGFVLPAVAIAALAYSRGGVSGSPETREEAIAQVRETPADARAWIRLARRSDGAPATAAYRIAARLDPADPVVQRAAAFGLARGGDVEGATAILAKARDLVAGAGEPWRARASQLALDLAEQLLWTDPDAAARAIEAVPPSPRKSLVEADVMAARGNEVGAEALAARGDDIALHAAAPRPEDLAWTRSAVTRYLEAAAEAARAREPRLAELGRKRALLLTVNTLPRLPPEEGRAWIRALALAGDPGRVLSELHSMAVAGTLDAKRIWGDDEWAVVADAFAGGAPRLAPAKPGLGTVVSHEVAGGAERLELRYPGESTLSDVWIAPLSFRTAEPRLALTARVKADGRFGDQLCVKADGRTVFGKVSEPDGAGWRTAVVSGFADGASAGKPVEVEGWCLDTRGRPGPFLVDDVALTLP